MINIYIGKGQNEAAFKIGKTGRPDNRLKEHQTANSTFKYDVLVETRFDKVEAKVLAGFESKRVQGRKECFLLSEDDLLEFPSNIRLIENVLQLALAVAQLKHQKSSNQFLAPPPGIREAYLRIRDIKEKQNRLNQEEEQIKYEVMLQIGSCAGIDGYFSWKSSEKSSFDEKSFKRDHPEMCKEYTRLVTYRSFRIL